MAAPGGGAGGAGGAGKTMGDVIGERLLTMLEAAEEKLDDELDRMEKLDEDDLERLRRKRLDDLKKMAAEKAKWAASGHGEYRECHDQRTFFDELKKEARAVVHFYRPATRRCEIVDRHLAALARKHMETKFIRVNAEKCPFLAERLKIVMLPTLVLIKDGRTDHSIIGFDEFGGGDNFSTEVVEAVLTAHGLLMESS